MKESWTSHLQQQYKWKDLNQKQSNTSALTAYYT